MANSAKDPETGLTARQEVFAQSLVDNPSLTVAYKAAYNVKEGTNPATVHNKAWELAHKPEIELRVKALRAAKVAKEQWTRDKLNDFIRDTAINIAMTASREQDKVAAIRLLGEMAIADSFAAKKTDATVRKLTPGDAKAKLQDAIERALASDSNVVALPKQAKSK
jgi:hypothetical protein